MLTYSLIQPSFAFLKLSSLYGAIPLKVESSLGTIQLKNSFWSRFALKFHHVLTLLKLIQLTISLYHLSKSVELNAKWLQSIVGVAAMGSAYMTGLVWSSEFAKYSGDLIILISPLQKNNLGDPSYDDVTGPASIKAKSKKGNLDKFARKFRQFRSYIKAARRNFFQQMPTFSIHDFLTIIVPMVVPLFIPVIYILILIGEPKEMFIVSLVAPESNHFGALWAAAVIYDIILITFIVMNFQWGFFILCSGMAVYLRELTDTEKGLGSSNAGMMSERKMEALWLQIRRLSILFNIVNNLGCSCFYAGKLMTFSCCVLGTFYILRFGFTDMLSVGIGLLACEGIMFYVLCLGNAYLITQTMNDILQNIKLMLQFYPGDSKRDLKQRIKSVRGLGFMEGGFRRMSEETTPEFVDFYLNQVIGLLLTFPKTK